MPNVTTFKRVIQRYYSNEKPSNAIKVIDGYGNEAFHQTLSDEYYLDFIDKTYSDKVDSGLLPPGIRALYPGIVVFERPPSMQMVQYVPMNVDGIIEYEDEQEESPEVETYFVPVPWQIYIASYSFSAGRPIVNGVKMFFSKEPLTHSDVKLHLPYIPNFFTNGTLCAPHFEDSDEVYRYPATISGVIASAYDWIWNTGFNADLTDGIMTNINNVHFSNNPVIADLRVNPSHDYIRDFYRYLSQYTPEEVNQFNWAFPSYTTYHSDHVELRYLYTLDQHQKDCLSDLGIELAEDETFEDAVSLSDFNEWMGNIYDIPKTYSDMCYSIFLDKNNSSEKHSNHRMSFNAAQNTSVTQDHFVNSLLSTIRNTPI